ncbi:hypothetical protein LDENG_00077640 [Lucifuga dentata]|nr:hypothetical protein LDENG_00077640 [Lucifuga dentata]
MMLSTWLSTSSFSTWTPQEPMPESCLWISALHSIIPALLQDKLSQLNVPDSTCRCITDFLSDRRQCVRLGKHVSDSRTNSIVSPQGCTNSCTFSHQSIKLLKFADDTILIGLISGGDESAYRWEIDHLVTWCRQNNLELNDLKTVEMIVDFRKNPAPPPSPCVTPQSTQWSTLLPGHHHHSGPQVGADHQLPHQESPAEDVFPAAVEEVQPANGYDGSLLPSSSPCSTPPLPSGTLLPPPRTKAGCSISFALLRE